MGFQSHNSKGRVLRGALLMLGALLVGYAVSDHPFYGGEPGFGRLQGLIASVGLGIALSSALPLAIAERVLLATTSGLSMLAVAELVSEPLLAPRHRPVFQADDKAIFKLIPDRRSTLTRSAANGGETVTHRINSAGFRGEELKLTGKAPRVVVYGDSFIHAPYTADKETFTAVLGEQLSRSVGAEVEMVNAGVSSYGPDQISVKMGIELPSLRPDVAVVAIFAGNDYGDLMRNKMARLDADGALQKNPWRLDPAVRERFELSQRESILVRTLRTALGSFMAAARRPVDEPTTTGNSPMSDWNFLLRQAEDEYKDFVVSGNDVVKNTHVDYYSADVALTPTGESARYKTKLMKATLRRIHDVASKSSVPLVFVFIPHPVDVAVRYDNWAAVDLDRYPDYRGRNQTLPLEEAALSAGVPFVSLFDAYRAAGANALYFQRNDDHWNVAGQKMAAELVSKVVAQELLRRSGSIGKPSR